MLTLSQRVSAYLPTVAKAFAAAGLAPEFGCALAHQESVWNPGATKLTGSDGAYGGAFGLFQMTASTYRELGATGTPDALLDVQTAIDWAIKLALDNAKKGKIALDNSALLAAAHNCGITHVIHNTIPRSTSNVYVPSVMKLCAQYRNQARGVVASASASAQTPPPAPSTSSPPPSAA